jgi:hypothetical protein
MRPQWTTIRMTVALAAFVSACSPSPSMTAVTADRTSLRIVESDSPTPVGMQAALQGTLTADESGCVRVKSGEAKLTPVWPRGYSVRGDSGSFEVLDSEKNVVARSGVTLTIGGGGAETFHDTWTQGGCAGGGKLWMVGKTRTG